MYFVWHQKPTVNTNMNQFFYLIKSSKIDFFYLWFWSKIANFETTQFIDGLLGKKEWWRKNIASWNILALHTGKKISDVLIYLSINPQYSIPLLGRFPSIIHQKYISRTSTVQILFWFSRSCILKVIVPRSQIGSQMGACFLWKVQGNKIKKKKMSEKTRAWKIKFGSVDLFFWNFKFPPIFCIFMNDNSINSMTLERLLSSSAIPRLYLLGSSSHIFCL